MIKLLYIVSAIFLLTNIIRAQEQTKEGKVGYSSAQLVYVNFDDTYGISEGDTLFIKSKNKHIAALVVKYLSSSSAACEKLNDDDFKSGLVVYAFIKN